MAIYRTGPTIGAISGNLGGVCFVQSKAGPVVRQRNRRMRQTDTRHTKIQNYMAQIRGRWQTITTNQRTAWRAAAANWPRTNRLGVTSRLSGYNLFIRVNLFLLYADPSLGGTFTADPPDLNPNKFMAIKSFDVVSGGTKVVDMTAPNPPTPPNLGFYGARTFSTAVRPTWYDFRYINSILVIGPGVPPWTLTAWDNVIGDPQVGEQCWVAVVQYSAGLFAIAPLILSTVAT